MASRRRRGREVEVDASRSKHVLVVDDYEDSRAMCAEYLEFMGYRVSVAADGHEALERARALPDLVLMDLSLPRLDGWAAIRELKRDPATRHIPVIVLTGHALRSLEARALEAGCVGFVTKPCLPQDLLEHVRRVLDGPPPGGRAPAPRAAGTDERPRPRGRRRPS
ncbi:MAG: response regulator [Planctomycetes bacterium]|nr:response regulator [Planctomycetota bacterium]